MVIAEAQTNQPQTASRSLAQQLRLVAELCQDRPVKIAEVVQAVQGKGYDLLLILISLPFLTPIPLPLLSTPFGIVVLLAGSRMALGQKPWWPRWILEKTLPAKFFPKLLKATSRIVAAVEYLVKPRLRFFHSWRVFARASGLLIALSGALLLLPVPVPLSNFFPALTVLLLACGALEHDGLFFLAGCLAFCCSVAYFVLLFFGGWQAILRLISGAA